MLIKSRFVDESKIQIGIADPSYFCQDLCFQAFQVQHFGCPADVGCRDNDDTVSLGETEFPCDLERSDHGLGGSR